MKKKAIAFNPEELVRSVEQVRDAVTGRRKRTLRTHRAARTRTRGDNRRTWHASAHG